MANRLLSGLVSSSYRTKPHVPYITGEPEVSYRELDPSRDRYLILATDGLWERVSNQEAATVVHDIFERQQQQQLKVGQCRRSQQSSPRLLASTRSGRPVSEHDP